jgi:hypothetical protein
VRDALRRYLKLEKLSVAKAGDFAKVAVSESGRNGNGSN